MGRFCTQHYLIYMITSTLSSIDEKVAGGSKIAVDFWGEFFFFLNFPPSQMAFFLIFMTKPPIKQMARTVMLLPSTVPYYMTRKFKKKLIK